MARKAIDETKLRQIITLKSGGATYAEIQSQTGLARSTIAKYLKEYEEEIESMKEDKISVKNIKPHPDAKDNAKDKEGEKKPEKTKYQPIEEETARKTITKASTSISDLKARELTEDYKAAQMLHSASVRYQKNIEMMGLEWDRFIAFAIDDAYERAVEVYKEKVAQQLREAALLETAITEELANPKPKTEDGMMIEEEE
jgi:transposase